jgi:hypothetical protein
MLRDHMKNTIKEMVTYSSCEKTKKEKRKVLKAHMETQKKGTQKTYILQVNNILVQLQSG